MLLGGSATINLVLPLLAAATSATPLRQRHVGAAILIVYGGMRAASRQKGRRPLEPA
jgi:hypothetical protein